MTTQQAFAIALQHYQAGRAAEAEAACRQTLALEPRHPDALHLLGLLAHQLGRDDLAVDLIRQSIALAPTVPDAHSNLGEAHRTLGQLDPAIAAYRQAIALRPNYPEAHYNLGIALTDKGLLSEAIAAYRQAITLRPNFPQALSNLANVLKDSGLPDEAIAACRQAIRLKPDLPQAHNNLGNALKDKGQLEEAITACRRAITLKPDLAEAHCNLGNALKSKDQLDDAIAAYHQAILIKPSYAEAHSNLGNALRDKNQLDEAITACHRAITLKPDYAEAYCNLGNVLKDKGRLDEAITTYRQTIALKPDYADAHSNLGNVLTEMGQLQEAIVACRQALSLKPDHAEARINLGNALKDAGYLDEAISSYRQAIAIKPDFAEAHSNLGNALKDKGHLDEAIASYRQAIALKPGYLEAHDNLAFFANYHPGMDAAALAEEHRRWNLQHAESLRQFIQPHRNDRSPARRLRVGYVSADLRDHPVGRFLLPLLAHHDHSRFEIFAYAHVPVPDAMTGRLRSQADHWHSLVGLSDQHAAELIRGHQIDILVDLALHTARNRLLVFARKPAPVQLTYLAYAGTSGLNTMDYRLSDPFLDPPGSDESLYSEQTLRLPQTYWCYQPFQAPPIAPAPAIASGHITFGCLNNFCKVNPSVLETWTRLLLAVPGSRLLLHAADGSLRQQTADRLQRSGIDPARLRFVGKVPLSDYLQLYSQIDLALDPFPYGGGTTTCDSLWMGVPVISLRGDTAVGRAGLSLLSNVGLPELVARSTDDYVALAAALAHDLPRLSSLRSTLRERMQQSPLMDAPRFASDVEAAFRSIWERWCAQPA